MAGKIRERARGSVISPIGCDIDLADNSGHRNQAFLADECGIDPTQRLAQRLAPPLFRHWNGWLAMLLRLKDLRQATAEG